MISGLGGILMLIGIIWLVVTAIQTGADTKEKVIWGLVNFFCQPLGGIVFYFMRKQGLVPMLMVVAGWLIMLLTGGFSAFTAMSGAR